MFLTEKIISLSNINRISELKYIWDNFNEELSDLENSDLIELREYMTRVFGMSREIKPNILVCRDFDLIFTIRDNYADIAISNNNIISDNNLTYTITALNLSNLNTQKLKHNISNTGINNELINFLLNKIRN